MKKYFVLNANGFVMGCSTTLQGARGVLNIMSLLESVANWSIQALNHSTSNRNK